MSDQIVVVTPEPTAAERRAIEIALEAGEERQPAPELAPWLEARDVDD